VGDTLVDMATATACNLRSLLVETGFAGLDYRASAWPDYTVPDLSSAVAFILEGHDVLLQRARQASERVVAGDLVLVGGLSRSGKSNFTSALAEHLRTRGLTVQVLALDRWLLSNMQRSPGVLGRYDLTTVTDILTTRTHGVLKVALPGYHKLKRVRLPAEVEVVIQPESVVIVEGTVALELSNVFPESHKIYVAIDEEERIKRVLREYGLRGLDEAAALAIYAAREKDEAHVIRAHAAGASIVDL
ncbi:MAG: nucleoside/nucleotide kinase family protein, partial [Leptospirales bacterium]